MRAVLSGRVARVSSASAIRSQRYIHALSPCLNTRLQVAITSRNGQLRYFSANRTATDESVVEKENTNADDDEKQDDDLLSPSLTSPSKNEWVVRVKQVVAESKLLPSDIPESINSLPEGYFLSEPNRQHLLHTGFVHLQQPAYSRFLSHIDSFSNRMLLVSPEGTQTFHESVARGMARHFQATFFSFDLARICRALPRTLQYIADDDMAVFEWASDIDREPHKLNKRVLQQIVHALFAAVREVSTGPAVVFIPGAERLVFTNEFRSEGFRKESSEGHVPMLVVGSVSKQMIVDWFASDTLPSEMQRFKTGKEVQNAADSEAELEMSVMEHNDRLDMLYDRLSVCFPNWISLYPPSEDSLLQQWTSRMSRDKTRQHFARNSDRLLEIMRQNSVTLPPQDNITSLNQITSLGTRVFSNQELELGFGAAVSLTAQQMSTVPDFDTAPLLHVPVTTFHAAFETLVEPRHIELKNGDKGSSVPAPELVRTDNKYENSLLSTVVRRGELNVKFSEIGALEHVKRELFETVILPLRRPELFRRGVLSIPCSGVLLFGPPGTGKTMLAKAVATESGANFLNVTTSNITSRWFGDSEKYVTALFSLARRLSPCVVFIDEVDSLLGSRDNDHEAMHKVKNLFMALWDGLTSSVDDKRILIMCATNRPFDIDDAVLRRLPRRVFVDLPTEAQRTQILQLMLVNEELDASVTARDIAALSPGFSGSDLKNLCIEAAYQPVREYLAAEAQRLEKTETTIASATAATSATATSATETPSTSATSETETSTSATSATETPTTPATLSTEKPTPTPTPTDKLRPLSLADFKSAVNSIGASVAGDTSSALALHEWSRKFGKTADGRDAPSRFGFSVKQHHQSQIQQ